ncbi:hypothetical protein ACFPRL_31675 [Pseudoclavibacter helvolus]
MERARTRLGVSRRGVLRHESLISVPVCPRDRRPRADTSRRSRRSRTARATTSRQTPAISAVGPCARFA